MSGSASARVASRAVRTSSRLVSLLEEPARHLRLTREAAEIDNGAGMGDRLGPDRWRRVGTVGGGNSAVSS